MSFRVYVAAFFCLVAISVVIPQVNASSPSLLSAEEQLETLLKGFKASLQEEVKKQSDTSKEVVLQSDNAQQMWLPRWGCPIRCAPWTRVQVAASGQRFAFECCIANGMLCLDPTENMPAMTCVNEEEGTCREISWRVGWTRRFTFQVCLGLDNNVCIKNTTGMIMPCTGRGGGDLVARQQQGNGDFFTLCHDDKDGSEDCISDGKSAKIQELLDEKAFCVCLKGQECTPKGCTP